MHVLQPSAKSAYGNGILIAISTIMATLISTLSLDMLEVSSLPSPMLG